MFCHFGVTFWGGKLGRSLRLCDALDRLTSMQYYKLARSNYMAARGENVIFNHLEASDFEGGGVREITLPLRCPLCRCISGRLMEFVW
jgi:hypothetical protein